MKIKFMKNQSSTFTTILLALACFALPPPARALLPPPAPDGGYLNGNTAEGQSALLSLTSGGFNTAVGFFSLRSDTTGQFNTALGAGTLLANTGNLNTATGAAALLSNTTGGDNTANGASALFSNTTGFHNTAIGLQALLYNTTGGDNTATGLNALLNNTIGNDNTAIGSEALTNNNAGIRNTAIGRLALAGNTIGNDNTAIGWTALASNTFGAYNTAIGFAALASSTEGSSNTAIGTSALSNTTGRDNTALGYFAGYSVTTASNVTCIGSNAGGANVNNTAWISNVYDVTTQSGTTAPVIVSDNGQLGTIASSERFKKDIVTMEKASEAIMSLRPVTFHYKTDTKGTPQFGLIAEEVAKVNPALVLSDNEGKPYTVRYDAVNAMLLNEFLKEHQKVEDLKKDFQATVAQQQKEIEALTAGLQKVSAQLAAASPSGGGLEASKPAPQVVNNP